MGKITRNRTAYTASTGLWAHFIIGLINLIPLDFTTYPYNRQVNLIETPYDALTPDVILDAIDAIGFETDGVLHALNSYENRVYQVGINDNEPLIAKFYRPERWSNEAILEEHNFSIDLEKNELPCVAPIVKNGTSLFTDHVHSYRFALFPRRAGQPPNVEDEEVLSIMGRTMGRLHAIAGTQTFKHRRELTAKIFGWDSRSFLLKSHLLPESVSEAYETTSQHLLDRIDLLLTSVNAHHIRIHGDCHLGNLLWRYDSPNFVDFDDTMMGPAIQDLWMLLSGSREEQEIQLTTLAKAYEMFCRFPEQETKLIEPLRSLRMIHHAAWIGRRWSDPAFPLAFPWFETEKYWSDHILSLREQLALLDEPPLTIRR